MVTRIRRGVDLHLRGAPRQRIEEAPPVGTVAVLGADYPGIRFDLLVEPGDEVVAGQPLLSDRNLPNRHVVSPVAGRVKTITRGARRSIGAVEIVASGDAAAPFESPACADGNGLTALLQASGLWAALRRRPFGRPADFAEVPEALFITAMDTRPHAPDPALVIREHAGWFQRGAQALAQLTPGTTHLCHAAGENLPDVSGVVKSAFSGRHPAGLPSSHIHALHPTGARSRIVWQIGYQDVIALGHLLETGRVWTDRIVAVSGSPVSSPALLRTRPGANLRQLLSGRLSSEAVMIRSGSILEGRAQAYLSRDHLQVFVTHHHSRGEQLHGLRHLLHSWSGIGIPAVIPNAVHERAAPNGILAIPLLRALSVGDADAVRRLGALELVEEDLALLTYVDGGHSDFGAMLRSILDDAEGET